MSSIFLLERIKGYTKFLASSPHPAFSGVEYMFFYLRVIILTVVSVSPIRDALPFFKFNFMI